MKIQNMHELFVEVLNKRDLSRAGDLFQIEDKQIVTDLSQLISKIESISSAHDFNSKFNDQSVIEICLTRIISALRDTGTIEKHSPALVSLLQSCLQHNLKASKKDEDPPHAKIASDVVSCIFLNHGKKSVMQLAIPVAIKLLHRGNKELSRNLSSYLSLAAINNADILATYIQPIIDSIIGGNYTLAKVLPKIYPIRKEPIHDHVMALVCLLPQCETPEKLSLLNLFALISKIEPNLLESNLPEFSDCLAQPQTAYHTLQIFLNIAQVKPKLFIEYVHKVVNACNLQSGMLPIAAQFLGIIGKLNVDRACDCLCFLTSQLSKSDLSTTITILREIKSIIEIFPSILSNFIKDILAQTENSTSSTVQNYLQQLNVLNQQVNSSVTLVRVNCDNFGGLNQFNCHYQSQMNYGFNSSNVYDYNQAQYQTKSSNFKLSNSNFKTISNSSNYKIASNSNISNQANHKTNTTYKLVNTINSNQNNSSLHRSIPRLSINSCNQKIGKQLSCSSNGVHHSLTNCSNQKLPHNGAQTRLQNQIENQSQQKQKSVSSSYLLTSVDSIGMHNLIGQNNSSPSSSSNQNLATNLQNSKPEITMMNINYATSINNHSLSNNSNNYFNIENSFYSGYSGGEGNSKMLLASSITYPSTVRNGNNVLDHPQLLQLSSNNSSLCAYGNCNNKFFFSNNGAGHYNINNFEQRDAIKHFCDKHIDKIKSYMEKLFVKIPMPIKCTIEERKSKKIAKLHFNCQVKDCHCLYSKHFFVMKTRNARIWIHLMFLSLQAKEEEALYTNEPSVDALKRCWDILKDAYKGENINNKSFFTLVTSSFPSAKDHDLLILELQNERYFDVFEFNAIRKSWSCFLCNHPEKVNEYLEKEPVIQGHLKEKPAKWKIFRRWKTRYFTLSGLHLSYRETKNNKDIGAVEIGEIQSVKAIGSSRGRNIPKAFEIFTNEHKAYLLKAKNSRYTEQWVQCLSIAMAHSQARETSY